MVGGDALLVETRRLAGALERSFEAALLEFAGGLLEQIGNGRVLTVRGGEARSGTRGRLRSIRAAHRLRRVDGLRRSGGRSGHRDKRGPLDDGLRLGGALLLAGGERAERRSGDEERRRAAKRFVHHGRSTDDQGAWLPARGTGEKGLHGSMRVPTGRGTCGSCACFPGAPPVLRGRGPDGGPSPLPSLGAHLLPERRPLRARAARGGAGGCRPGRTPGERASALSAVEQAARFAWGRVPTRVARTSGLRQVRTDAQELERPV